jgi:translocation and assembly module TamA
MIARKHPVALLLLASWCTVARAADPQPYRVDMAKVGNGEIDDTLEATSDLQALRSSAPVSPFGLIARARSDVDRLTTVLESFGYYESRIVIKVNGIPLTDPGLSDALTVLPKGDTARVAISFTLGPLYTLRHIEIEGEIPAAIDAPKTLGLTTGQPAVAGAVLAGGARLLTALEEAGYAFARVDPPVATEAPDAPVLDLKFDVVSGMQAHVGEIRFEGLRRLREPLLRRRLLLHAGDRFKPSLLERARRDLLSLNVFAAVSVEIGRELDPSGGVPITFKIRERPRHAASVNAAFSSDLGGSGGITWTDRNVFGGAQQLTVAANIINLGGSDTTGTGYDTSVKLLIPEFGHRDQSLQVAVSAIKQSLQAYDQTSRTASLTLLRKLSSVWSASVGIAATDEHIIQPPDTVPTYQTFNYTLLAVPLNLGYDSTDLSSPLDDPVHGLRVSMTVKPTLALGHPNSTFIITEVKAATYFDLDHLFATAPGRTVLAARALAGVAQGAGETSLPPDQRFYGGGSGTIRGYAYQLVGPQITVDEANTNTTIPLGGTAITAGSIELRQRFGANFGAALFADAGQVSTRLKLIPDELSIGVGTGLRYYTPIGPIRLDVAVPTKRHSAQDAFEVYIGLGQAF